MNSKKTLAFATLGLLAGCTGSADLTGQSSPAQPELDPGTAQSRFLPGSNVASDLLRLEQLRIVDVGNLVLDYPEGAMNCYGPCPGFEDEIAAEDARQAARLAELVVIATDFATRLTIEDESCSVEVVDENLAALDGLDIVQVFGLIEEVPQNNPYCYNLPCPADIARADEINRQRATALANIVAESTDL
jgi:hypothetical protein